ncbi:uncharacterized protein LOC124361392 [Homalodisca vitripennis]|uniref:uncharacterized protein LOC124361392 n=1 Tax=Homalodisca vitripennis TaxID=197043 RepID=UPI001EEA9F09|nr:uncharacterized protein LOC124361392 [Homalodisca vitripennis]
MRRCVAWVCRGGRVSSLTVGPKLRSHSLFGPRDEMGAPTQPVVTTRDLLIQSLAKSLPSVTRDHLADYCAKEKNFKWNQVTRPTPLSVVVHTDLSAQRLPFYKVPDSLLVQAALSKTRETWTPAALKRKLCSNVEDTPFLRTPLLPRLSNLSPLQEGKPGVRWHADDTTGDGRAKRARLVLSPSTEQTTHKTETMDMTCPESCALLHTPLVSRLVKQPKEATTPHSILKGSATNTPVTPARSDKTLVASVVSRQISFSHIKMGFSHQYSCDTSQKRQDSGGICRFSHQYSCNTSQKRQDSGVICRFSHQYSCNTSQKRQDSGGICKFSHQYSCNTSQKRQDSGGICRFSHQYSCNTSQKRQDSGGICSESSDKIQSY